MPRHRESKQTKGKQKKYTHAKQQQQNPQELTAG